ncbi:hypothetical protein BS78_10G015800 [Paspalum vaginatum]|nr:hypothetical protein BS78_10G015800 [Paspalum vaginatum]
MMTLFAIYVLPINIALEAFKANLRVSFFMELIILVAWSIWLTRNSFIFRGVTPTMNSCLVNFVEVCRSVF